MQIIKHILQISILLVLLFAFSGCPPNDPCKVPAKPTLSDPGGVDTDGNYTVSWSAVNGATNYKLQEAGNSAFSNSSTVYDGPSTSKQFTGNVDGTYYYRVNSSNNCGPSGWSNTVDITVDVADPPPEPPTLSAPSNGSTTSDNTPYFDWSEPAYAHRYELIVDDNSSFLSPIINPTDLSSSSYTAPSSLNDTLYYWKVRAKNSSDNWGNWSAPWHFTVSTGSSISAGTVTPGGGTVDST